MPGTIRWSDVVRAAAFVGAAALVVIGLRFLLWPVPAAWFFGMALAPASFEYHYAIALRDLWLGALLLVPAWRGDMRSIALWFGLAAPVCFGDAWIAASASGRAGPVAFHVASGLAASLVAALAWQQARRRDGVSPAARPGRRG